MALQAPDYRPYARGAEAPRGFQPQTQRNNGGPVGLGQPRKTLKTAINPQSAPTPSAPTGPPPGVGNPANLYPPDATQNAERLLWANRNSVPPDELIQQAFVAFLQRAANPDEIQYLLSATDSTDTLVQQLLALKPAPQNLQSAILGPTV